MEVDRFQEHYLWRQHRSELAARNHCTIQLAAAGQQSDTSSAGCLKDGRRHHAVINDVGCASLPGELGIGLSQTIYNEHTMSDTLYGTIMGIAYV